MIVVGHRGAPNREVENSWSGFDLTVSNGVQRVEIDVQVSKDGVCFVIHDENLKRLTGENIILKDSTSTKIQELKLKNNSRIPKLSEILDKFNNRIELNLEIKSQTIEEAEIIMRDVEFSNFSRKIVISSFQHSLIEHLKPIFPKYDYALLYEKLPQDLKQIETKMNSLGIKIIHPEFDLMNKRFADLCQKNAWDVVPYISIDKERITRDYVEKLKILPLAGICTNYPIELGKILNAK